MKQKITKRFLDTVSPNPDKDEFYSDTQLAGFGVKITKGGKTNFIVNARIKGQHPKRVTIGQYPDWNVYEARDEALSILKKLRKGIDPIKAYKEKQSEALRRQAQDEALSVSILTVLDQYLESRDLKAKTKYDYINTFNNCFLDWADRPLRSITRQEVEKRYQRIQRNNRRNESQTGVAQANKAMQILNALMNFASAEEINGERLIQDNPVNVLKEKRIRKSIKPRDTYIDQNDLWKVVRAIECLENQSVKHLLLLLVSTGLRLNEATTLEWENLNFEQKYFVVLDTKNKSDHVVPMSTSIEWLLKEQNKIVEPNMRWVFPSINTNTHVVDIRKNLAKVCLNSGVTFTPHDLRRTFATIAHCCGLDHTTVKRVMNHKHKDITEQYIQTKVNELRKPMQEIDDYIDEVIINNQHDWELENLGYVRLESEDDITAAA